MSSQETRRETSISEAEAYMAKASTIDWARRRVALRTASLDDKVAFHTLSLSIGLVDGAGQGYLDATPFLAVTTPL